MNKNIIENMIFKLISIALIICFIFIILFILFKHRSSKGHYGKIDINTKYNFPTENTPEGVIINSPDLVENSNFWNGRTISFVGEAIGENMARGKMAWIHINDDIYMVNNIEEGAPPGGYNSGHAVWLSLEYAEKIRFFGDYNHKGDIIKVTGTFNSVCKEHGGDMDIHATSMEIIKIGHRIGHDVNLQRMIITLFLFLGAGVLFIILRKVRQW